MVLQEPYKTKFCVNYSIATTFVGTLWLIENTRTLTVASVCKDNMFCTVLINTCVKCTKLSKALKQVLMVKILAKWTCCENLRSPQTDVSHTFTKYINRVFSNKQKKVTKYTTHLMTACNYVLKTGKCVGFDLKWLISVLKNLQ